MEKIIIENEDKIIQEALRRLKMKNKEPGIPGEKVTLFIARIGELLEQRGKLEKQEVDELLRQLHSGEI